MVKYYFSKMNGAGNDFIMIDLRNNPCFTNDPELVKLLCNRRIGIGADGLITIQPDSQSDFRMTYYNADGFVGSLCGNGARCTIRFAHEQGYFNDNSTRFVIGDISYSGNRNDDGTIKFFLNPPSVVKRGFKIKTGGKLVTADYADTGSPHVIVDLSSINSEIKKGEILITSLDMLPVFELGREIRYLPEFAPAGVNVNFIDYKDGRILIRTYERGVEDETLACGTGSVAAAVTGYLNKKIKPPVVLHTKSGELLTVDFSYVNQTIGNLSLTGPAEVNFTGEFILRNEKIKEC